MQGLGTAISTAFGNKQAASQLSISLKKNAFVLNNLDNVPFNAKFGFQFRIGGKEVKKRRGCLPKCIIRVVYGSQFRLVKLLYEHALAKLYNAG